MCDGIDLPACPYAHETNPEQSKPLGLFPPYTYGVPITDLPALIAEPPPEPLGSLAAFVPLFELLLDPVFELLVLELLFEVRVAVTLLFELSSVVSAATAGVAGVDVFSFISAISALICSSNEAKLLSSDCKLAFFSFNSDSFFLSVFLSFSTCSSCVEVTCSISFKSSLTASCSSSFSSTNSMSFCCSSINSLSAVAMVDAASERLIKSEKSSDPKRTSMNFTFPPFSWYAAILFFKISFRSSIRVLMTSISSSNSSILFSVLSN